MNIVLTQSHYSDNMWALFHSAPEGSRFLLRSNGVYLIQNASDKLLLLKNVFALNSDTAQRGITLNKHVTPCSISSWIEHASTDSSWATF